MHEANCGFSDSGGKTGSAHLVTNGPTLPVNIGFDPAWDPNNPRIPTAAVTGVFALVDTGATESHIDADLATSLNLPVVDQGSFSGAGGLHKAFIYLAQVYIPSLDQTIYGQFAGVKLAAGGQVHQALLGRTFLRAMSMVYEGLTGKVVITRG